MMLTCSGLVFAGSPREKHENLVDSLKGELARAATATDSIRLYYDLFDVSFVRDRYPYVEEMYKTAVRCGDTSTRLDALRLMANMALHNDSLQEVLQRRASLVSGSPEQKETVVFIKVARAATAARSLSGEELRNKLHMVLQGYRYDRQVDLYRRIELLFVVCKYLEGRSTSNLLFNYLRDLETLIKKLPSRPGALRSMYYTAAANANTEVGRHAQAVEADKNLLQVVHEFENRYKQMGREFCKYTTNYYIIYRRMLSNYEALSDDEIEDLYSKVQRLAKLNPDIADDMISSGHLVDAYYYMAKKQYSRALPLLMNASAMQVNRTRCRWLLQMAITAATACGNDAALLEAHKRYLPLIESHTNDSEEDQLLEYQVLYDVSTLEANNADLEEQFALAEQKDHQRTIVISGIAIAILALVAGLLFYAYRRTKRMSRHLDENNRLLTNERDNLRRIQKELIAARDKAKYADQHKSDFINSISHEVSEPVDAIVGYSQLIVDSIEDNRRGVLDRFVQIIQLNAQLLRTLVNDVLDVAELENSRVMVKFKNVTLRELCEVSADTVRSRVPEGVKLTVEPMEGCGDECSIDTDPTRAEQVIINLLTNAAKFTEKGSISVLYGIDTAEDVAKIVVEDTGSGIPAGKEQKIFERFYKGSQITQGIGLGLPICRLVSRLLGGSVDLDTTYTSGARFIFTLPINNTDKAAHAVAF
jgi:signal transduction histidine kinase